MNWEYFFNNNIMGDQPNVGYLIWDLEEMNKINVEGAGNCGYPMLMSILSGMELLGGLINKDKWDSYSGEKYFCSFYETYFEKYNKAYRGRAAEFYKLLRHKLAHTFLTAIKFRIAKNQFPDPITNERGLEIIDVGQIFNDFKKSIIEIKRDLKSNDELAETFNTQLPIMLEDYGMTSDSVGLNALDNPATTYTHAVMTTLSGTLTRSSRGASTSNATTAIPLDIMANMEIIKTKNKKSGRSKIKPR